MKEEMIRLWLRMAAYNECMSCGDGEDIDKLDDIAQCPFSTCPLHPIRPFQDDGKENTLPFSQLLYSVNLFCLQCCFNNKNEMMKCDGKLKDHTCPLYKFRQKIKEMK